MQWSAVGANHLHWLQPCQDDLEGHPIERLCLGKAERKGHDEKKTKKKKSGIIQHGFACMEERKEQAEHLAKQHSSVCSDYF